MDINTKTAASNFLVLKVLVEKLPSPDGKILMVSIPDLKSESPGRWSLNSISISLEQWHVNSRMA